MTNLANSHSLNDFQRDAPRFLNGLNKTQEPLLLTVNGQVHAVILDPETFQQFEKFREQEKFMDALREGLQDLDDGRIEPLNSVKAEMKAKYGV